MRDEGGPLTSFGELSSSLFERGKKIRGRKKEGEEGGGREMGEKRKHFVAILK